MKYVYTHTHAQPQTHTLIKKEREREREREREINLIGLVRQPDRDNKIIGDPVLIWWPK